MQSLVDIATEIWKVSNQFKLRTGQGTAVRVIMLFVAVDGDLQEHLTNAEISTPSTSGQSAGNLDKRYLSVICR